MACGTWDETLLVRWPHGTRIRPADFKSTTLGMLKLGIPKVPDPNHGGFDSIRQSPHDRSSSAVIWVVASGYFESATHHGQQGIVKRRPETADHAIPRGGFHHISRT